MFGSLPYFRTSFRKADPAQRYAADKPPLRSELFSRDQMEQHGKALAASHKLSQGHAPDQILERLSENEDMLISARNMLRQTLKTDHRITPAGEWLLDNFYLIEEQFRIARRHLPKGYSRELPRLLNGSSNGIPRVYDIALETISHGDGRVDPENLSSFVTAYQTVSVLKLGELWAIPIMLRLALIENLRRVAARIAADMINRDLADYWADQMIETAEKKPNSLILVIADMVRSNPPMVSSFVAEFTRRLHGQGSALALPLSWIEQRLSESGLTIEQSVHSENQQQAADQVSISNSIGSLRFLGAMDWAEFVEKMSSVEHLLREDPAGVYSKMDFATRDHYRHIVEKIAKSSLISEIEVALMAIGLAQQALSNKDTAQARDNRMAHVGFYLIDKGLPQLERLTGARLSISESLGKLVHTFPMFFYVGLIALVTIIFTGSLLAVASSNKTPDWLLMLIGILLMLSSSQLAVELVNWLSTLMATPHQLPKMDYSKGIPQESRTLVVIPTLLTSAQSIEDLIEALEVRFLANRDENLHLGLLTDFTDAKEQTTTDDKPLLQLAREKIEELNNKYHGAQGNTFFLFHRARKWNPREQLWMGYERKRGKLADLNSLLLRKRKNSAHDLSENRFSLIIGNTDILPNIKYVITLDTDTQLPRDSARQFAGAIAHPLNRPHYDKNKQRVVAGYSILQPRVAASLPGINRSLYARMCGNEPGIDPYTRAVSDVYQDLFGEGSFIGKGIYDAAAFDQALNNRFPENLILSHDLLEGCYARAGLLSDVPLYEEYPSCYSDDVRRRHRWIRGDWQIAQWLLPRVPGADPGAHFQKNPLSGLSRWKIFDNLRRSIAPSAFTILLLICWAALSPVWFWTLAVIGIILISPLMASILEVFQKPDNALLGQHLATAASSARRRFSQALFTLMCLPFEAFFSLDAVLRTAWRMLIRRRLLEWSPSSSTDHSSNNSQEGLAAYCRMMWISPVISASALIYLLLYNPAATVAAAPLLLLWFVSPFIAWLISRPIIQRRAELTVKQVLFLRQISRKTWAFFETFVGPADHWLPPDNYQEYRVASVAHRTSPTNMGVSLLANLSAYDFGYIPAGQLIERSKNALNTMESMDRHHGHFYNWYDTLSLKPLIPAYISTVDSGNLAAHLLTLRAGLHAIPDQKIFGAQLFDGLNDTLRILTKSAEQIPAESSAYSSINKLKKCLEAECTNPPETIPAVRLCMDQLAAFAAEVIAGLEALDAEPDNEANWWARAFASQCHAVLDDLIFIAPSILNSIDNIPTLRELAELGNPQASERIAAIELLALQSNNLAFMEYDFLFDPAQRLLSIGYNVAARRKDPGFYDLLASEARLCCFVAIAQGQLPQESWFSLGRLLTTSGGEPVLLSWSGSMFEYLMPLLVMPTFEHTLLDQTYKAAVNRQIEYGKQRSVPWGISESAYNTVDAHLNYQYRAFGVPGLGLKRGLADDLVIAPYASALALIISPEAACSNLQQLSSEGFEARYGFYEAIDYTPSRQRRKQKRTAVRSFMAHHQGMSLLSLAHLLLNRPMQKRFESDPLFQATMLLLHERIPRATALYLEAPRLSDIRAAFGTTKMPVRVFNTPDTPTPEVQLLSNGRYHVMITNAGGGYSRWKDISVTRWREDTTCDNWGMFCYLRDVASGQFWSTAYQPALKLSDTYEAIFSEGRAEFRRSDFDYDTHTEIVVSPEDDIELRRTLITNSSRTRRTIEVTSYAEVVLAPDASDALHPAFGNLFIQTEIIRKQHAVLCTRRPRSIGEKTPWMFHLMTAHGAAVEEVSYETDRMEFIGRGRTASNPKAMSGQSTLSESEGSVLDPIVAIRYRITLEPEASATIDMVSGLGETRDICMGLIEKYQEQRFTNRVFDLAWTHSQVVLQQLNVTESDAQLYGRLAGSVVYANSLLRADNGILRKNSRGQSGLWGYAISGDLPIVLLRIEDPANIDLVRQLVQAHAYWRLKGLAVDLVIWNENHAGYRQLLQDQIIGLIAAGVEFSETEQPGGIFVRLFEQISNEDRILLQTVARAVITDSLGPLVDQVSRRSIAPLPVPRLKPTRTIRPESVSHAAMPDRDLIFFNELGGFSHDGREYIITTTKENMTPSPWVNVLANPNFGTIISESGISYTWSGNAHEFRLTPWHNDPVSDSGGEAFYLRDEESGLFWSPSPLPSCGNAPYVSRHGLGYSVFEHTEDGIRSEMWVYVAMDASVKFTVLKIRNESGRSRRLSVTGYAEWVLGDLRPKTAMHISTEIDHKTGALFGRNPYNTEFTDKTAFFAVDDATRTLSGDRTEFLGRNGTIQNPAAMTRARLSGKTGTGLDPCAAMQVAFDLADRQEREIIFMLGIGQDADDASSLVRRFRGSAAARKALEAVWLYWNHTLGAVQIETPDQSVNVLANGWLLYQTLACRIWARSGYYQSGGAFGFRDQLQDVMALIHSEPRLMREHLLLCAAHQFKEGDVQHWWHPPSGRGVRTHCSDDFLWLPLAACRYIASTGDTGVLDETIHFIEGRPVNKDEDSYYDLPHAAEETASLYDHCVRSILNGLSRGEHGLPLIGSGDWNDGMNMVGSQGKGESVWLGFFLYKVLIQFSEIARQRGDLSFVERCREEAAQLQLDIEETGWDGHWYRRAYFDDGTPLGSALNSECRIDSIAQSWSVLSGAGDAVRSKTAMESLDRFLVRRDHQLIQLLDPPFDKSDLNPGYIKGYVPGVRENGGQYTHSAIWAAMAFAQMGDNRRAWELLAMINPVNHTASLENILTYKVEPYVMAADVYAVSPHTGRGGWTWYTGSAGWMYRLILESLLGLKLEADKLRFEPCLPEDWDGFKVHYRYRETVYHISVVQTVSSSTDSVTVDGIEQPDKAIPLVDDHKEHVVEVKITRNSGSTKSTI
ncbi:MAG: cyclic beta 1-2 glucan synthetase [Nitrospirae bacterium]|nr:cyclic beta 1-2 glucan synthetase [Nitrospirota bacterium]